MIELETARICDRTLAADLEWLLNRGYCRNARVDASYLSSFNSFNLPDGRVASLESKSHRDGSVQLDYLLSGASRQGHRVGLNLSAYSLTPAGFAVLDECDDIPRITVESDTPPPEVVKGKMKSPSKAAFQVFYLCTAGGKTQTEAAEIMQSLGKVRTSQGQVSRWLEQVEKWTRRGNVIPGMAMMDKSKPVIHSVNPSKLDRGKRTDSRKRKPKSS